LVATRAKHSAEGPSRTVLAELPARVATFLQAVSENDGIRAALAEGGYGPRQHRQGFVLLYRACPARTVSQGARMDEPARKASESVARWVRKHFPRLRTTVELLHPEATALLDALRKPEEGAELLAVAALLSRVESCCCGGD
jgi:hypothetical protein